MKILLGQIFLVVAAVTSADGAIVSLNGQDVYADADGYILLAAYNLLQETIIL